MHRHAVRSECLDLLHCLADIVDRLLRQTHDQVHIDIVKSQLPRQQEFFLHILHRMTASDEVKRRLLHRLRIDGNTGNAVIPEHLQLFARDAVRTSRLNGKFNCLFHRE